MKKIFILLIISLPVSAFLLKNNTEATCAEKVKSEYLLFCREYANAVKQLQHSASIADRQGMQQHFLSVRNAYKKAEPIIEYFFPFYAVKLNGPPIIFFEESEADMPENTPEGMQVIEGLLFPAVTITDTALLSFEISELVRRANELETLTTASFAFTDATVFEALMEAVYRVGALGITGFDSQTAQNGITECNAVLEGIQKYIACCKEKFTVMPAGSYEQLQNNLRDARIYLAASKNFNSFNRMEFLVKYLNPVTTQIAQCKKANSLEDSKAGLYYSSIKKNNTLFEPEIFNPQKFIDDYTTTAEKIILGRMLFFEKQLSADNSRSCASCHQPEKAFTDGLPTSLALNGHTSLPRNAPTIWNAALQRNLFTDSRSRNLEEQVMQVLNSAAEMHGSAQQAATKIIATKEYKPVYAKAYPEATAADAAQNICNAIACYERTLIALNSRFDKHMNGSAQLTANEINGFNIFMGKAKCGTCHFMPLFGGAKPPRYYYTESEVIGVPANKSKKNAVLDKDSGRYNHTGYKIHLFSFKTPSVRNAAVTAPYMHNGVYNTLEEVVDFYNNGGGKGLGIAPVNQSLPFEKLRLTTKEKKDLVSFIKSLTDTAAAY